MATQQVQQEYSEVESPKEEKFFTLEAELLHYARHGKDSKLAALIHRCRQENKQLNLNCKGESKFNRSWSPLHLAAYFGHMKSVDILLQNGADVNIANKEGDTPLHKAAYTGRQDMVSVLLQHNASVYVINAEGHTPRQVTNKPEINEMIQAAENVDIRRSEEDFLSAARDGNVEKLAELLKGSNPPSIDCTDKFGNTALHCASYRRQKEAAVMLLQNGVNPAIKNNQGQTAAEMARTASMKQILDVQPVRDIQKGVQRHEGALLKKTRLRGWQSMWGVLERGVLSYFNNRGDATTGVKRKGVKYLDNARIKPQERSLIFIMDFSDSTRHTLAVPPESTEEASIIQLQKWMNNLKSHIAYSTHYMNQGTQMVDEDLEDLAPLGTMQDALQTALAHQMVLEMHITSVASMLEQELTSQNIEAASFVQSVPTSGIRRTKKDAKRGPVEQVQLLTHFQQIGAESKDMCNALTHCMTLFQQQEELRKVQLQQEMEKTRVLQEALHALATEHHELEHTFQRSMSPARYYDTDDDEFYDCDEGEEQKSRHGSITEDDTTSYSTATYSMAPEPNNHTVAPLYKKIKYTNWGGRTCLPVPMFSRNDFSVWSILKQCIGKELSKITMPVIFNEPMSFLQRLTEYMEYHFLLDTANNSEDPVERIQYVTAFAVSASASNWDRLGKPFNPLLGETYEYVRDDLGWKIVCEQVSHHPPISAFHVESPSYRFHGTILPKLKFWGKSVEVQPKGTITVELLKHGETYTWHNVNCSVHNIIVGKLWVEHSGQMEVINHKTNHRVVLNYKPCGWFGKDAHKLEGVVFSPSKEKLKILYGSWIDTLFSVDPETYESWIKSSSKHKTSSGSSNNSISGCTSSQNGSTGDFQECDESNSADETFIPRKASSCDLQLPGQLLLWKAEDRPSFSKQYYSFTAFAMTLNELSPEQTASLPATDSRLRPDIRKLEDGDIDGAAEEKVRLEEKQRAARKDRKKKKEEWRPCWFMQSSHPETGKEDWLYTGEYWVTRDFKRCPDIF